MKAVLVLALATLAASQPNPGYGGGSSTYPKRVLVDVIFNSEYHFSWKHDGGQVYDFKGANDYCKSLGYGWRGISFETLEEDAAADNVLYRYGLDSIWTSGFKQGYDWVWATGKTLTVQDWSPTGGAYKPQPDNREGNEECLAVLNNAYKDGIKWHDVAGTHKKPIICERTISSGAGGITSGGSHGPWWHKGGQANRSGYGSGSSRHGPWWHKGGQADRSGHGSGSSSHGPWWHKGGQADRSGHGSGSSSHGPWWPKGANAGVVVSGRRDSYGH